DDDEIPKEKQRSGGVRIQKEDFDFGRGRGGVKWDSHSEEVFVVPSEELESPLSNVEETLVKVVKPIVNFSAPKRKWMWWGSGSRRMSTLKAIATAGVHQDEESSGVDDGSDRELELRSLNDDVEEAGRSKAIGRVHCRRPSIEQVVQRAKEARAAWNYPLTKVIILSNRCPSFLSRLSSALANDGWVVIDPDARIKHSIVLNDRNHVESVNVAVDMALAEKAEVFLGSDFSTLSRNVVLRRMSIDDLADPLELQSLTVYAFYCEHLHLFLKVQPRFLWALYVALRTKLAIVAERGFFDSIGSLFGGGGGGGGSSFGDIIGGIFGGSKSSGSSGLGKIGDIVGTVLNKDKSTGTKIGEVVGAVIGESKGGGKIGEAVGAVLNKDKDAGTKIGEAVGAVLSNSKDETGQKIGNVLGAVLDKDSSTGDKIGKVTGAIFGEGSKIDKVGDAVGAVLNKDGTAGPKIGEAVGAILNKDGKIPAKIGEVVGSVLSGGSTKAGAAAGGAAAGAVAGGAAAGAVAAPAPAPGTPT
ncbi:hypothetical protein EST38_g14582, partial [Candolleomyces aberdarensis]